MMAAAVIFARTYEQRLALRDAGPQASTRGSGRMGARSMQQQGTQSVSNTTRAQAATTAKTPPFVKRLTTAEITERRKDGCCFHCDELFINGHKLVCKQLFIIELIHDDESPGDNDGADPTISIHVLTARSPGGLVEHLLQPVHRTCWSTTTTGLLPRDLVPVGHSADGRATILVCVHTEARA
jgi:hypothetical protein